MSVYGKFAYKAINDVLTGATLKAMLLQSEYVFAHTHEFRSSLTANEVSGAGYTAGGVTLATVTVTLNTTTGRVVVLCDEIDYGAIDVLDCAGIAYYIDTGSSATDRVIGHDFWATQNIFSTQPFSYLPNADDGIVLGIT